LSNFSLRLPHGVALARWRVVLLLVPVRPVALAPQLGRQEA
jgi:hypothetical protein